MNQSEFAKGDKGGLMPRVTIEDRRLVIRVPLELIEVPSGDDNEEETRRRSTTIIDVAGDFLTARISLRSLTDSGKRNLLEALMTNAEVFEKKPEKVVSITRPSASSVFRMEQIE